MLYMEGREGVAPGGFTLTPEVGGGYQKSFPSGATSIENPNQGCSVVSPSKALDGLAVKKKRGRPRKYAQDGTVMLPLNPMPISASLPALEHSSAPAAFSLKRGRGRPGGFLIQQQHPRIDFESLGVACAAGANFTPHIIAVAAGEDVTMKIMSFSQQGPRAICILSANGVISNVSLRQPDSLGGTLTYEGRFELLSLSGSFMPNENSGTKSRSGGMSVSLVSSDGRVVGGGVAGLLIAASPVQVVVGSFLPSYQLEQKSSKPNNKVDDAAAAVLRMPPVEIEDGHLQQQFSSAPPKLNLTVCSSSSSFKPQSFLHSSLPDIRINSAPTDINISPYPESELSR